MTFIYDESYYTRNNYAGYLERAERYERMTQELEYELFRVLKLNFKKESVLDYGCGVGYVVSALTKIGYTDVFGYDVSEWATNWGKNNLNIKTITTNISTLSSRNWELMIAFDVFEHMEIATVHAVLSMMEPEYLLVRIPLAMCDNGKFVLAVSENDPTHITRLTRQSWHHQLSLSNYSWLFNINLGSFYDTDGVMCAMFRASHLSDLKS